MCIKNIYTFKEEYSGVCIVYILDQLNKLNIFFYNSGKYVEK